MKMTNAQLTKVLTKEANSDLALARKHGSVAVHDMKVGNIEIRYRKFAQLGGQYMIVDFNNTNYSYAIGRKAEMVKWLVENYQVIHE